jgi:replicative DNA helicase
VYRFTSEAEARAAIPKWQKNNPLYQEAAVMPANAKGSGSVKDISDVTLELFRDRFAQGEERTHLDVKVIKVKEGPTGKVALQMDLETGRITPRDRRFQDADYLSWYSR